MVKTWVYIGIGATALILFLRAAKNMKNQISDSDILGALYMVQENFGNEIAKQVERMYRLETNHFRSEQFKKTLTAGMEATTKTPPSYGWGNRVITPYGQPIGLVNMTDSGKRNVHFVQFGNIKAAMYALASYLKDYGVVNGAKRWYGNPDERKRDQYIVSLNKIQTTFV